MELETKKHPLNSVSVIHKMDAVTCLLIINKSLPCARSIALFPRPAVPAFVCFLNIGAFLSMSGSIRNRIFDPRMYTFSSWATRPSRYVTVIWVIWQFMLSSASINFPLYTSPVIVSQVTMCPSASCNT